MYHLNKYILIIFLVLSIGSKSFGQGGRPIIHHPPNLQHNVIREQAIHNKVEHIREAFISKKLELKSDESEKFWPVYRRYQEALREIRKKKRLNNSSAQENGTEQIQKELYYESEIVNTRKYYTEEFLKILPPDKVSALFKGEREFTDELIKQLAERNEAPKNNP